MTAVITSLQNPRVKEAVGLRDRRHRQRQRRILIDGARELGRAVTAGVRLQEVFLCEPLCQSEDSRRLLAALPQTGAEILTVTERVFEKLAFGHRAEGVLGVAEMPERRLADLALPPNPLVAVLEGVEKPGNIGAVLRSADGAGLDALLLADPRTDLYNPNAIRASLGTIFSMPVVVAEAREVLKWLGERAFRIFAARVDGSISYAKADYLAPTAFVLGNEAAGITPLWEGIGVADVRLPMLGIADSLNVSAAAAVLFYEARRQRDAVAIAPT